MKLLCELPEKESNAVQAEAPGEKILFSLPANVSLKGEFVSGFTVVTERKILSLAGGRITHASDIGALEDYRAVSLVGNGMLEARTNGDYKALARYSMEHAPGYGKGLEDSRPIAFFSQVISSGETSRPGANNGHLFFLTSYLWRR